MVTLIAAFLIGLVTSAVLTPIVSRLAVLVGAVDHPEARKVHSGSIPRMGGVAVFIAFAVSLATYWVLEPHLLSTLWLAKPEGIIFGGALLLVMLLGIWDDINGLSPARKAAVQVVIATLMYAAGFRASFINTAGADAGLFLVILEYVLTVLWIVGITNAVNLIDGLDGLAAGVATISALTIVPIAYLNGDPGSAVISLLLAGALIGFLRHNFNPARIFLGDSGSLFLGLALSVLSMTSSTKTSTFFSILVPMLALGLPIIDTSLSMLRRLFMTFAQDHPAAASLGGRLKHMFLPDRSHIHHRLLERGLSHRNSVVVLYGASLVLGAGALGLTFLQNREAFMILIAVGIATVVSIRQLRYSEISLFRTGALLPFYERDFIHRGSAQAFLDIGFIVLSFLLSQYLASYSHQWGPATRDTIILGTILTPLLLLIFWLSGMYKGSIRLSGIRDGLRVIRSVSLATLATWVILSVAPFEADLSATSILLNFYFLITFCLGSRLSFKVLRHLSRPDLKTGRRVLIYGAGRGGVQLVDRIFNGELPDLVPVGFLDEDPVIERKTVHGLMVFGGHWKLASVARSKKVDEVIITVDQLTPELERRIYHVARRKRLKIRQLRLTLQELVVAEDDFGDRGTVASAQQAG
jgi:UDP-GlcNAc:undecaprenyl-phosphate GlcNAc-1-phosphate transferase